MLDSQNMNRMRRAHLLIPRQDPPTDPSTSSTPDQPPPATTEVSPPPDPAPSSSPPSSPSPSLEAPPPPPSPPSEPTPATEEPPASQESPVASPAETLAATGESGIETSGAVLPSSSGALTRPLSSILSPTVASTTVALDTLPGGVFGVRPTDSPSSSQAGTAEEPSKVVVGGIITAVFVVVAVAIGLFLHYRFRKRRATLGSNDMAVAGGGRIRKKGSMGRASSGSSGSGTYRKFDDDRGSRASTASRMSWFYLDGKKQTNSNFVPASSTSPSLPGDEVPPVPSLPAHHMNMEQNHHQVGYGQPQHIMADDESINGDGRDAVWRSNADRSDPIGIMSTYKNTSAYNMQQITAESDSDNAIYIPPPPVNAPQPAFGSLPRGSSRQASLNNKNNAYNRDSILSTDTATPILLAMMDATRMGNSTPHSPAPSSTSNQSMPIQAYYGVGRAPTMTAIPEDRALTPASNHHGSLSRRSDGGADKGFTPVPSSAPAPSPKPILKQSEWTPVASSGIRTGPRRLSVGNGPASSVSSLSSTIGMGGSGPGLGSLSPAAAPAAAPAPSSFFAPIDASNPNGNPFRRPTTSAPSPSISQPNPFLTTPTPIGMGTSPPRPYFTPPPVGNPFREPILKRSTTTSPRVPTKPDPRISVMTTDSFAISDYEDIPHRPISTIAPPSLILSALNEVGETSPCPVREDDDSILDGESLRPAIVETPTPSESTGVYVTASEASRDDEEDEIDAIVQGLYGKSFFEDDGEGLREVVRAMR